MTHTFKKAVALVVALLIGSVASFAQAPEATAKWSVSSKVVSENVYELTFKASIVDGWHIYTVDHAYNPISIEFASDQGYSLVGGLNQVTKPSDFQGEKVFFDSVTLTQRVKLTGSEATVTGEVSWSGCNDRFCAAPESWEFSVPLAAAVPAASASSDDVTIDTKSEEASSSLEAGIASGDNSDNEGSLWALIIEAILWGFAMLMTPCVFPMVPMTVSFFMKQSSTAAEGRFKAFIYGLFIVLCTLFRSV